LVGGRRRGEEGGEGTLASSWRRSRGGRAFVGRSLTIVDIAVAMAVVSWIGVDFLLGWWCGGSRSCVWMMDGKYSVGPCTRNISVRLRLKGRGEFWCNYPTFLLTNSAD